MTEIQVDAPMPSGVEKMTKQELWNWFSRSQRAAYEKKYLEEKFFTVTTGLHSARLSGNPYEIIEMQRKRIKGLETQMSQMQKGYDKKLKKALKAQPAPTIIVQANLKDDGTDQTKALQRAVDLAESLSQPAPTEAAQGDVSVINYGDVPAGWKLVPVELTDDMLVAFAEVWYSKTRAIDDCEMADCYAAMLAVAPEAPAETREKRIQRQNMQGMADCMKMVHGELIEAGIIAKNTPPMMITNAVCAHIGELRAAAAAVVARWDTPMWKHETHTGELVDRLRKALATNPAVATYQPSRNPRELAAQGEDSARLDAQVTAAARVLANRSADQCGVNRDDNWQVYGQDFIDDARAALDAARAAPQPQEQKCQSK